MTKNVIQLPPDPHREIQLLIPWYVTGRLPAQEAALVTAHVAACPDCEADLRMERRLQEEVREFAPEIEPGWTSMAARIRSVQQRPAHFPSRLAAVGRRFAAPPLMVGWKAWAAAATAVAIVLAGASAIRTPPQAPYRTLSAPQHSAPGNLVVVFRPEATEMQIRFALRSAHARLVGGPTAADAYVLLAPQADRDEAISQLRSNPSVVLAEPIDEGEAP